MTAYESVDVTVPVGNHRGLTRLFVAQHKPEWRQWLEENCDYDFNREVWVLPEIEE